MDDDALPRARNLIRAASEALGLPGAPAPARAVILALLLALSACFAWFVLGVGDGLLSGWKGSALNVVSLFLGAAVAAARALTHREERVAWGLMAGGLALWATGGLYWWLVLAELPDPPFPSVADGLWLAFYGPVYASMILLARRRVRDLDPRSWIDGLIAALAVGAVASSLVLEPVIGALGGDPVAVAVNLAYPIADTLLLALLVGVVVGGGARHDRMWLFVGVGLLVFAVTDSIYLVQIAEETYAFGTPLEMGWVGGIALIGLAAWQPGRVVGARIERDHGILVPVGLAVVSLALLVVDHFSRAPLYAVGLAAASMALVLVRLVLSNNESRQNLRRTRRQALTDSLTGLGNRLSLMRALEAACDVTREPAGSRLLLLFDLDGFKNYNDSYGHPAGDALLRRLGERLAAAVAPHGTAYRMGGDEFCVLLPGAVAAAGLEPTVEPLRAALIEHGDGFRVGASYGHVAIPAEARNASDALRIADRRLYAAKNSGRLSARIQSTRVLAGAMKEWDADLGEHGRDVGDLAARVARRLGLEDDEIERVVIAAELHDIGKIAVPQSILQKPGPLDEDEWEFIRRHTLIGERIVQGAPALASVGRLIRSSHERWDGRGYPDGLAGDDIPLGAQIVFVCDALAAMTTDRAYHRAISEEEALLELRANAGTQFSPRVVEAVCQVAGAERAPLARVA